ncbi:MAG: hypothetical protein AB8B52_14005 [Winogradskyella sp.]|uniref:hypothetical protein n=1 Tax=Winogradskyella sp. TaxID=1883156 RepID=UPI00385BF73B
MKTYLTFIVLLLVGFISTAQYSTFDTIEDAISIKPNLTLIDWSDESFSMAETTSKFNSFKYAQNLTKQLNDLDMSVSMIEPMREGFIVFSPDNLKRNFFKDFNTAYKRSQLERLLPRLPDISDFTPCF